MQGQCEDVASLVRRGGMNRTVPVFGFMLTILQGCVLLSAAENSSLQGMTEAHNRVRRGLGLQEMKWSADLAATAQEWADYLAGQNGCKIMHRPDKGKHAGDYGENIFWASAVQVTGERCAVQVVSPAGVVEAWASESHNYDYGKNSCREGSVCGHYTQIVWSATRYLGCGMAVCADKGQIWVCNYDPPGNYRGQKPYTEKNRPE